MNTSDFIKAYKTNPKSAMTSLRYDVKLQQALFDICKLSPDEYSLGEAIFLVFNPMDSPTCSFCNTRKRKFYKVSRGFSSTCNTKECNRLWRTRLNIESSKKIDWEASKSKREKTCIKKYGKKSNLSDGTKSREYSKERLIELHGVDSPLKNKEFLKKREETCLDRFGTTNFIHSDKTVATMKKRYNCTNIYTRLKFLFQYINHQHLRTQPIQ